MTETADILIIGGGVMGTSIAYNRDANGARKVSHSGNGAGEALGTMLDFMPLFHKQASA